MKLRHFITFLSLTEMCLAGQYTEQCKIIHDYVPKEYLMTGGLTLQIKLVDKDGHETIKFEQPVGIRESFHGKMDMAYIELTRSNAFQSIT